LIGQAKVKAHGNTIEIAYRARVPTKDGTTHDLNSRKPSYSRSPGRLITGCVCRFCLFQSAKRISPFENGPADEAKFSGPTLLCPEKLSNPLSSDCSASWATL
jgi:hypothetical protein